MEMSPVMREDRSGSTSEYNNIIPQTVSYEFASCAYSSRAYSVTVYYKLNVLFFFLQKTEACCAFNMFRRGTKTRQPLGWNEHLVGCVATSLGEISVPFVTSQRANYQN